MADDKPVEGEIVGNELAKIIDEQGLVGDNRNALVEAFGGPFKEAGDILVNFSLDEEGKLVPGENAIKITDVTQVKEMSEAREMRLKLRQARITIENKRKELGEEALRTKQAIDGVARQLKKKIEPVEEYLAEQEKFKELREKAEAAERLTARTEAIAKFTDPTMYNLADMAEESFQELLIKLEKEAADKAEAERKAEEDRIAAEKAERDRQAKIAEENKRLQQEAEEQRIANERKLARVNQVTAIGMVWSESLQAYKLDEFTVSAQDIIELNEVKWKVLLSDIEKKVTQQREAAEAARRAEEAEREAELQKQREAAEEERKRREALEQQEADRKAAEEKAQREKEAAERELLLAPDKEKILAVIPKLAAIKAELPATKEPNAQELVKTIDAMLDKAVKFIEEKVEAL
jgi:hypothetical protein